MEFTATEHWRLRGGYSYGHNPVPSSTLTPLTAAIMEHTIATGAGWENKHLSVDFSYQWSIPNRESANRSALRSGEYSNSRVEAGAHWFGLIAGVRF